MSIWSSSAGAGTARRAWGVRLLWLLLPLLSVGYQVAAKKTASAMVGHPLNLAWFIAAANLPWARALIGLEIASFLVWMVVLSEMKLSAAFPMTALGYVLVIAVSWTVFGERGDLAQVLGGAAIMAGVWLISREPEASP